MATLAQQIAVAVQARHNCEHGNTLNAEWLARWTERLDDIARNVLPSGSGFDNGTTIDLDNSNAKQLAFETSFHHMNEHGMYDGWTEHRVVVKPAFDGFTITVSGRNRNDIKDYIAETFHHVLSETYEWPAD